MDAPHAGRISKEASVAPRPPKPPFDAHGRTAVRGRARRDVVPAPFGDSCSRVRGRQLEPGVSSLRRGRCTLLESGLEQALGSCGPFQDASSRHRGTRVGSSRQPPWRLPVPVCSIPRGMMKLPQQDLLVLRSRPASAATPILSSGRAGVFASAWPPNMMSSLRSSWSWSTAASPFAASFSWQRVEPARRREGAAVFDPDPSVGRTRHKQLSRRAMLTVVPK